MYHSNFFYQYLTLYSKILLYYHYCITNIVNDIIYFYESVNVFFIQQEMKRFLI